MVLTEVSIIVREEFRNIFRDGILIITETGVTSKLWCCRARNSAVCRIVIDPEELIPPEYQPGSVKQQQETVLSRVSLSIEESKDFLSQAGYCAQNA